MSNGNATTTKPVVLVTGSSGLIGSAVLKDLAQDYQVVGLDAKVLTTAPKEVECIGMDLTSQESVRSAIERVRFAYRDNIASVIHLAAYYNFSGEPSPLYEEVTVKGTERLLHALQPLNVQQFVFSSTMLIHRPTVPGRPITEQDPIEGKWDYPKSKIRTEKLIESERGNIPAVFLRIAGVYTDYGDSIPICQQIKRINERQITAKVFPGDINHGQAFVHLDDLVSAIRLTIERRADLQGVTPILIGEPETYSYDRLQREIARLLHNDPDWDTNHIPKAMAKSGAWVQDHVPGIEEPFIKPWMIDMADDHYELDIGAAQQRIGWNPQRRLFHTLPHMIQSLVADPEKWYEHHDFDPEDVPKEEMPAREPATAKRR